MRGRLSDLIPRIATSFGAGIGRRGEVCGALAGGVMGFGLKFGRCAAEERGDGLRPHWYAIELVEGFRTRYGCVRCGDLLELDLSRPGDVQRYHETGLWDTRCREIIETAAGLAYDLLVNNV